MGELVAEARSVWAGLEFRLPMLLRNVEPLGEAQIRWVPGPGRNPIAWQLWHIAEVEDNWVRTCLLDEAPVFPFGRPLAAAGAEYPSKAELLACLRDVRGRTRTRLEGLAVADFDRRVRDPDFGEIGVRELWAGVVTSFAWHAGQIALTAKLLPDTPVTTWTFTGWREGSRGGVGDGGEDVEARGSK
jgi:hypothetical protein